MDITLKISSEGYRIFLIGDLLIATKEVSKEAARKKRHQFSLYTNKEVTAFFFAIDVTSSPRSQTTYFDALTHCYINTNKSKFIKWLIRLKNFLVMAVSPETLLPIHSWPQLLPVAYQYFTYTGRPLWEGSSKVMIYQVHSFTQSNQYFYLD